MTTVLHIITGLDDGGAEAVLHRLCIHNHNVNHTVVSLTSKGKYGRLLVEHGISVHTLDMPRGRLTLKGLISLYRLIRRDRPDVVQTWMYHGDLVGGVIARLAGVRAVYWNIRHTELGLGSTGRSTRLVARTCALLSRLIPTLIVTCASRAKEIHVALGYDENKFIIIPNGCNTTRFTPNLTIRHATRAELGADDTTPLLGLVARWNLQKDHASLLEAISIATNHHWNVKLVLAGEGCTTDNGALVSQIAELGLGDRVVLLGPRNDVPRIMNALDIFVLSSSHGEAFPNVLAEAMACGTPCVTTDVGDAAVIVGDTGWVVPPTDAARLAGAVVNALDALQNSEHWRFIQDKARQRVVDNFSLEMMVEHYKALWSTGSLHP